MNTRGFTPVLGLVLLLGLTTIVALSLLLLSATMLGNSQAGAETQQVEQSLTEFAQSAERIANGETAQATYEIRRGQRDDVQVDEDAGFYEVTIERSNGTEVLTNGSLGAYEYDRHDGDTVAFQGGGVWRANAQGEASVVQPPKFHYRANDDPTLTLPIVRLADGEHRTASGSGDLVVTERRDVYPVKPRHTNPLHEGVVHLNVESEYCSGWEQFFGSRTDGAVVEGCSDDTGETVEGELLVQLSVPFHFDGLGSHTAIAETITGAGDVHGSTDEGPHDMESATGVIERKVEDCRDDRGTTLTTSVDGGGLYCDLGDMDEDTYVVDPDGEDVEIAVDGRFEPDDLHIVDDGTVTVFVNGPALPMPGDVIGNPGHPERLRIVVRSGRPVGGIPGPGGGPRGGGNMDVYGLLYAPNSIVDFSGNADLHGGVVAETIDLQSGAASVHPDPEVLDADLEFDRGGEPFYYLHVSETVVELQD